MSLGVRFDTNLDEINILHHFELCINQFGSLDQRGLRFYSKNAPDSQAELVAKVKGFLKAHLKNNDKFDDAHEGVVERHWQTILDQAAANIGEDSSDPQLFLTFRKVQQLYEELNQIILGIEPRGILPWDATDMVEGEHVRNVLKYVLHDLQLNGDICNCETLSYFAYGATDESLQKMKEEFQLLLILLFAKIHEPGGKDNLVIEMLIGQVIGMIAFMSCFKEGDILEIPIKIVDEWKLIKYKTHLLPLNPPEVGEVIEAVYWTPDNVQENAPELLAFKATRGALSWFADCTPFMGVGKILLSSGVAHREIDAIFEKHRKSNSFHDVQVYGLSLGAALAYRVAQAYPGRVNLHAYGPPGIEDPQFTSEVRGDSFMDPNDLVSLQGKLPDTADHRLIKVIRGSGTSFPLSHLRLYGGEETLLLRVNTAYENARMSRRVITFLHDLLAIPFGLLLGAVVLVQAIIHHITNLFWVIVQGDPCCSEHNICPTYCPSLDYVGD